MTHALVLAWADSINVLLIGVILALGVSLKKRYAAVVTLLVAGDWLGVFLLALATLYIFDGLQESVHKLVSSPIFGIILIAVGVLAAVMAWRNARQVSGGSGKTSDNKIFGPIMQGLKKPSLRTVLTGFVLGVVQSATSAPFFGGLLVLSASGLSTFTRYAGLVGYASVALSLPALSAVLVGQVRMRPNSVVGRWFQWMRAHPREVSTIAGYVVAVLLIGMGITHL